MQIIVRLDVMPAWRKRRACDLAARIGLIEQNLSLPKSGKAKGIRFEALAALCAVPDCPPFDLFEAAPEEAT